MTRRLLLLLSLICLPATALAAETAVRGAASCGEWVAQRQKSGSLALTNTGWLIGFLAGLAQAGGKEFPPALDNAAVYAWMDDYCREHPLKDTAAAAGVLVKEWPQKRAGK